MSHSPWMGLLGDIIRRWRVARRGGVRAGNVGGEHGGKAEKQRWLWRGPQINARSPTKPGPPGLRRLDHGALHAAVPTPTSVAEGARRSEISPPVKRICPLRRTSGERFITKGVNTERWDSRSGAPGGAGGGARSLSRRREYTAAPRGACSDPFRARLRVLRGPPRKRSGLAETPRPSPVAALNTAKRKRLLNSGVATSGEQNTSPELPVPARFSRAGALSPT